MNLLVDELPIAVEIDGIEYEINSDFRSCLRIILAFEDPELSLTEKQSVLLGNFYKVRVPPDYTKAAEAANKFLNGGNEVAEEENANDITGLYSFTKDAQLIYAAFRQTHGVDLNSAEMHWWQFLALFMDLGADTAFCNLIALRKRVKTGKATREEREAAEEMGNAFEIEEIGEKTLTDLEAEAEFFKQLEH